MESLLFILSLAIFPVLIGYLSGRFIGIIKVSIFIALIISALFWVMAYFVSLMDMGTSMILLVQIDLVLTFFVSILVLSGHGLGKFSKNHFSPKH